MHARDSEAELRRHVYARGRRAAYDLQRDKTRSVGFRDPHRVDRTMFALIRKFMALDDDNSSSPSPPTYFDIMDLIAQDGVPFQNPGNCIGSVNCIAASGGRAETG